MSTINPNGKVGYMYDEPTDTFHPLTGIANSAANYSWSGEHTFLNNATFTNPSYFKNGINNFQNPAQRDLIITSPTNGTIVFIRQDSSGSPINQIQAYYNGLWFNTNSNKPILSLNSSHTLTQNDAGKVILVDVSTTKSITIPPESSVNFHIGQEIEFVQSGAGSIEFLSGSGVTINSFNSYRKTAGLYATAKIIKTGPNTWILSGNLIT